MRCSKFSGFSVCQDHADTPSVKFGLKSTPFSANGLWLRHDWRGPNLIRIALIEISEAIDTTEDEAPGGRAFVVLVCHGNGSSSRGAERTVSQTSRPLLMADELMRTSGRYQIVLLGRLWPMVLKKTPYWKQPSLRGRFHPNPYREGRTSEPGSLDEWAANWGSFYYMLVWWMAPHPLAAIIMAAPIMLWLIRLFGGGAS